MLAMLSNEMISGHIKYIPFIVVQSITNSFYIPLDR